MRAQARRIMILFACWLCVPGAFAGRNPAASTSEGSVSDSIRQKYGDRAHLTQTLQAEGLTFEKFRQRIRATLPVRPQHDWTIKFPRDNLPTVYGLQGNDHNTTLRYGKHVSSWRFPFYGSVAVVAAGLCVIASLLILLFRPKHPPKQPTR